MWPLPVVSLGSSQPDRLRVVGIPPWLLDFPSISDPNVPGRSCKEMTQCNFHCECWGMCFMVGRGASLKTSYHAWSVLCG